MDLFTPPQKTAGTAGGDSTPRHKKFLLILSWVSSSPPHISLLAGWEDTRNTATPKPLGGKRKLSPGKFTQGTRSSFAITGLLHCVWYSRSYCQLYITAETSKPPIAWPPLGHFAFATQQHKQLSEVVALVQRGGTEEGRSCVHYYLLFRDIQKYFVVAKLLTDNVGHYYRYFTQPTALLPLN